MDRSNIVMLLMLMPLSSTASSASSNVVVPAAVVVAVVVGAAATAFFARHNAISPSFLLHFYSYFFLRFYATLCGVFKDGTLAQKG